MTNKDIIKQYADIGQEIPEYQFNKLNPSLLKTYLRKRVMSAKISDGEHLINTYEYIKLTPEQKIDIIPCIYLDYNELPVDELKDVVDKMITYLIKVDHLPQLIAPDYEDNQIYNIFTLFLDAYKKNNIDNLNLIKRMMKVFDSKLSSLDAYHEYHVYLEYITRENWAEIMKYYLQQRPNLEEFELNELERFIPHYNR